MDSINFNHFLRARDVNIETLVAREQALRSGAVLEYKGKRYHVQILCTPSEGEAPSKLFFRIYTESHHEIRCFEAGKKGKARFIGEKSSDNTAIFRTKIFYKMITKGTIIEHPDALLFKGELNAEEQAFHEAHPQPAQVVEVIDMVLVPDPVENAPVENPPVESKWTRNQKSSVLMIAVIATIAIGYGTKIAAMRWNLNAPTMPKLPTLGDLKASLERLNIWRKSAPALAP